MSGNNGKKEVIFPDTNALLRQGESLINRPGATVIVAGAMIGELDHFKHEKKGRRGRHARRISGIIADLGLLGNLETGIATKNGGKVYVLCSDQSDLSLLPDDIPHQGNDAKLLALAKRWQNQHPDSKVKIITGDHNLIIWANLSQVEVIPSANPPPTPWFKFLRRRKTHHQ
ncbi:MAG: PIN domain-containing protein [Candidatus Buchananbacteria bacterium]